MLQIFKLAFIGLIFSHNVANAQCVDSILSKIFFSANFSKRDSSLINFFKTNSEIKFVNYSNPRTPSIEDELEGKGIYYKYTFSSLHAFNNKFASGELTVVATRNNQKDSVYRLELKIGFSSRKSRDSFCKELTTLFNKCPLDDFEPIGNAPSEFYVGVNSKRHDRSIIIAETPLEFYYGALILIYFESW
jgi:hypothetical protein